MKAWLKQWWWGGGRRLPAIRSGGHRLAEYMDSNECRRAAYAAMQQQLFVSRADAQTQTDKQVSCRSSQVQGGIN